VKISVGAVEVLRKKERQDETQFTTKIDDVFLSFTNIMRTNSNILSFFEFFELNANVFFFFAGLKKKSHSRVLVQCFPYFTL
jgi:hypothetical protein